jgi:hypothetical protein
LFSTMTTEFFCYLGGLLYKTTTTRGKPSFCKHEITTRSANRAG